MMQTITTIQATYTKTGVRRFDGNPLIEALPPLPETRRSLLLQLSNYPDRPTRTLRRQSDIVRTMELSTLSDIVYPFPDYEKCAIDLSRILRESYVARNPLTTTDITRRHALACQQKDGLPFPSNWKSTAQGHCMLGITGMGKSTFSNAFFLRYPHVIEHSRYRNKKFSVRQVVYIVLSVPHDATLRGLCIQFFRQIDHALGDTKYAEMATTRTTIAHMVQLMHQAATAVSLGIIIIDDVQHLRSATGANAEFMLNLFSEIMERLGIALFVMATPAIDKSLVSVVRNTRKSISSGCTVLTPMKRGSEVWDDFCETYWPYSYMQKQAQLTNEIKNAWFDASAGDTAFAVLAFLLTQRNAIGGKEVINAEGFQRTEATDMAILHPAIQALNSRQIAQLTRFDDLLFGKEYSDLLGRLKGDSADEWEMDEFDEVLLANEAQQSTKSRNKASDHSDNLGFPVEDPLARYLG